MSAGRKVGLALVALLLTLSLTGSAVLFTGHQTVLSADFVKESADESGVYEGVQGTLADTVSGNLDNLSSSDSPFAPEIDAGAVANESVTDQFVRTQVDSNIDRLYAFLHGERETLNLSVNTTRLKDNLANEIGEQARDIDLAAVVNASTAGVDTEIRDTGVRLPLNGTTFERMTESESAYNAERTAFQDQLEAALLDRVYEERSPAELLPLIGENPDDYTQEERQRIVEEREEEIKTALAETDEFQQRFDSALQTWRDEIVSRIESRQVSDRGAAVQEPVRELLVAMVDGLFTDQSYAEFTDRVESARTDLADAVEQLVRDRIEENFPDEIALTEGIGEQQQAALDQAAEYVQLSGPLGIGLFLFSLLLVGGGYAVSRSVTTTLLTAGSSAAVSGLSLLLVGTVGGDMVLEQLSAELGDAPSMAAEFVLTLLGRTFGFLTTVSAVLLLAGIVAVGGGIYRRRTGAEESSAGTGTEVEPEAVTEEETETGEEAETAVGAETEPETEDEAGTETEAGAEMEPETGTEAEDEPRDKDGN